MTNRISLVVTVAAWVVSMAFSAGVARAADILPVDLAARTVLNTFPKISIFEGPTNAVADKTAEWLPRWLPPPAPEQQVYIVVRNSTGPVVPASIRLIRPTSVGASTFNGTANPFITAGTTSAYPGKCTNVGSASDPDYFADDFALAGTGTSLTTTAAASVTGFLLTSRDCGGMAVVGVQLTAGGQEHVFTLPQDTDFDGIPDIFERTQCGTDTCLNGSSHLADNDAGPSTNQNTGDGIADFDEYRGFIVFDRATNGEKHVRTAPNQKDLFVHLVNPQCGAESLLGRGTGQTHPIYPTGSTTLVAFLSNLISDRQVHLIGHTAGGVNLTTDRWVDRFHSYSFVARNTGDSTVGTVAGFVFHKVDGTGLTRTAPADDRQINANAVLPGTTTTGGPKKIQKGLRVTECLDTSDNTSDPLMGSATVGTPNGGDNAIIFSARIKNKIVGLVAGKTTIEWATYIGGRWSVQESSSSADTAISRALQYYLAMEIGHSTVLTPAEQFAGNESLGNHFEDGSGDIMARNFATSTKGSTITFRIPSLYVSSQSNFKLK